MFRIILWITLWNTTGGGDSSRVVLRSVFVYSPNSVFEGFVISVCTFLTLTGVDMVYKRYRHHDPEEWEVFV